MAIRVISAVLNNGNLDLAEKLAMVVIADAVNEDGEGWVKQERIAEVINRHPRTVERIVRTLVKKGELSIAGQRGNRVNIYRVLCVQAGYRPDTHVGQNGRDQPDTHVGLKEGGQPDTHVGSHPTPMSGSNPTPMSGSIYNPSLSRPVPCVELDDQGGDREGVLKAMMAAVWEATGWDPAKDASLYLSVAAEVKRWAEAGFALDRDVRPALDDAMTTRNGAPPTHPRYFTKVLENRRSAADAAATVEASPMARLSQVRRTRVTRIAAWKKTGFWPENWGEEPTEAEASEALALLAGEGSADGAKGVSRADA